MRLETETHRRNGVTLVAVRMHNDGGDPQRVRVANRCDGAVWPPRECGLPASGWDDGGWEGVLDAGECRPLGYATPGDPADPPAEFAWTERAADGTAGDAGCGDGRPPTPRDAVADLGDPRPPRDAVTPPTTALPEGVREWLDDVANRAADGESTDADRNGVAALAARARRLRGAVEK